MDPVTTIGLASAIVTLVDLGTKIAKRIKELSEDGDIPGVFRDIELHLPAFLVVLVHTEKETGELSLKTEQALAEIVRQCFRQIDQLNEILDKIRISKGDSWLKRSIKAGISLVEERPAQKILTSLRVNVQLLKFLNETPAVQTRPKVERWTSGPLQSYKSASAVFFVPFSRDKQFVGRETHLRSIATSFEVQNRVAVSGIGGVG